jgi:hypothetical protein
MPLFGKEFGFCSLQEFSPRGGDLSIVGQVEEAPIFEFVPDCVYFHFPDGFSIEAGCSWTPSARRSLNECAADNFSFVVRFRAFGWRFLEGEPVRAAPDDLWRELLEVRGRFQA